jgi:hypothetical protein
LPNISGAAYPEKAFERETALIRAIHAEITSRSLTIFKATDYGACGNVIALLEGAGMSTWRSIDEVELKDGAKGEKCPTSSEVDILT